MITSLIAMCNRSITILFYLLFFFVPLFFVGDTFELFEFNKMWLTFGITILISFFWISKMILEKRFFIKRTPFDIPLVLFLLSQIIATFHSLDVHTSIWGYYSRFNGGLLSLLSYILLYYAFTSNLRKKQVVGSLYATLLSGICVALWGFPSHFGHDPTCLMFRGNFDVSCWTDAFQPKIRMFSTLGQPDWLGAYLALLLPLVMGYLVINRGISFSLGKKAKELFGKVNLVFAVLILTGLLFYFDLIWTQSRSAVIGFWVAVIVFAIGVWFLFRRAKDFPKLALPIALIAGLLVFTFLIGTPFFDKTNKYTLPSLITAMQKSPVPQKSAQTPTNQQPQNPGELGGTDSGKIRLFVWQGAIDIWKHNPIFGTGVETFAYAYYQHKPIGHNLTSEWDYLYNKAHNEYLNYLATTGIVGLGTYLLFLFWFLWYTFRLLLKESENTEQTKNKIITLSLFSGFISIVITNFFGFSVVIMNIYLFIIPAFVLLLNNLLVDNKEFAFGSSHYIESNKNTTRANLYQWTIILVFACIALWMITTLIRFWNADREYALGYNLDRVQNYQQAFTPLHQAVAIRPGEPTFQDELTANDATLAQLLAYQKDSTQAGQLANEAITVSNNIVANHPNDVVFWKTRVRVFYILSQFNPKYLQTAIDAANKAHELAPTDAKVMYNIGLLDNQAGNIDKAISDMQQTITLRPIYGDAYLAIGIFYHEQAVGKDGKTIVNPEKQQQAVNEINYLLKNLDPNNTSAKQLLKSWQ